MKKIFHNSILFAALFGAASFVGDAQINKNQLPSEKAIAVDAKVALGICIASGDVTVRGWERSEVRALVENGKVNFKVIERNAENQADWIVIQGFGDGKSAPHEECLSGDSIELEIPRGASIKIKSGRKNAREGDWRFDSIRKVTADNINGDIYLSNISGEIHATSLQGSIAAEDSSGKIHLKTVGGDVAAFRLNPNEATDVLTLNSVSGNVVLRDVKHKNIEAGATMGELSLAGTLARGGNYNFSTTSGKVSLFFPIDFNFQISATMSSGGNFQADFPVKLNTQKTAESRRVTATNGTGETVVNLTAFNGFLWLKKK